MGCLPRLSKTKWGRWYAKALETKRCSRCKQPSERARCEACRQRHKLEMQARRAKPDSSLGDGVEWGSTK